MSKPRSDAKLLNLAEGQQERIIVTLRAQGYEKTLAFCADSLNIKTSVGALNHFWNWWHSERLVTDSANFADQIVAALKKTPNLDIDDDKLTRIGQAVFEAQAIKREDAKTFIGLQKVRISKDAGKRDERRIAVLEKKAKQADDASSVLNNSELSEEQKAARMREIFRM